MRKQWMLLLVGMVLPAALLAGRGQPEAAYTDPTKTIDVAVGKDLTIALESNPTTGYSWQADYDKAMLSLLSDEYEAKSVAKGIVGSGGTQYLTFTALAAGRTSVTLTYRRSWEEPSADDRKEVFNISIQ